MLRFRIGFLVLTVLVALVCGGLVAPGLADSGPSHRVRSLNFGVSGGNVLDTSKAFCCSGTLGALLTDGTNQYILSNNHVLARSDSAVAGEDISQPGLIDSNCRVSTVVADFTIASPLGSNVDAAIAQLRPGQMNSNGAIEDIGVINRAVVNPSVGLSVMKSGRTTGFTSGSITSVNTSVSVQYQKGCNQGKKFTVSYSNQVVIEGSTFSAGGDSGSLIVSSPGLNPVALLYAGSSSATIANPIGEVLQKLSQVSGRSLSFVGNDPAGPTSLLPQTEVQPFLRGAGRMRELPQQAADRASAVLELHRNNLMSTPGVIGAGVGASAENDTQAAIVVYVDRTNSARPVFAQALDGIPIKVVLSDPFIAF